MLLNLTEAISNDNFNCLKDLHDRILDLDSLKERCAEGRLELSSIARETISTESSDPRGKVYAFLGVIKAEEAQLITVDYEMPTPHVYAMATYASLTMYGWDMFGKFMEMPFAERLDGLPSWALDFSTGKEDPYSRYSRLASNVYRLNVSDVRSLISGSMELNNGTLLAAPAFCLGEVKGSIDGFKLTKF